MTKLVNRGMVSGGPPELFPAAKRAKNCGFLTKTDSQKSVKYKARSPINHEKAQAALAAGEGVLKLSLIINALCDLTLQQGAFLDPAYRSKLLPPSPVLTASWSDLVAELVAG